MSKNIWAKVGNIEIRRGVFYVNKEECIDIASEGNSVSIPLHELGFFAEEINRLLNYCRSGAGPSEGQLEFPDMIWGQST